MLFKEMEDKKYIYPCQPNLKKCSMDFRPPFIYWAANVAIVLSPTLRTPSEEVMNTTNFHFMNSSNTIIIWNIRGAHNDSFMRNLKEIITLVS
ncbi:hypothetical protein R3W88_024523 [Solanum pinnatisectum]|uniref:Uncharacterized protein n=1 Tax=Solanum pinnatisectum TaxID=50273 RepID=A0AAV9M3K0_9SOLN|nr:hypothetical protein R3W88_024523 [Solanum pinnatisectum]